ncbi:hypothetical protein [Dyadobacter crusticola]|uniref:hypothetical protein n=1 Tax=Dyadobacter crusticola TaxID=292407 RepID=UPI0004E2544B|nr:hypothetical protein [Dyadobacter crusticola]
MNIIYTVCNRTNLPHALTLADSVQKFQPDSVFYLCWVDNAALPELPAHIKVINILNVAIPGWDKMVSRYFDFELLAACRPWVAQFILNKNANCQTLTFLAPTVVLFQSTETILNSKSDFFLTPNILKPLRKSSYLDDKRILNIGMFHSGSWTLRNGEKVRETLTWWANRTLDRAAYDLCNGMNMDQLWLNYIPVFVPKTEIVEHSGWHFGLHAVLNKDLSLSTGQYLVDNQPLISIDFAGLTIFDPIWSNHYGLINKNNLFKNLLGHYEKSLASYKHMVPTGNVPVLGKVADIQKYRIVRNNLAGKLKAITTYIDQF